MTGSGSLFDTSDPGQQPQALVKHTGGSDLETHLAEAQRENQHQQGYKAHVVATAE